MTSGKKEKEVDHWIRIGLIALAALLVILCFFLIREYDQLKRDDLSARVIMEHHPASAANPQSIQSWMTFDYIDRVFSLPSTYLQTALLISDSRYPHLTISEWARATHVSATAAVSEVIQATAAYAAPAQ